MKAGFKTIAGWTAAVSRLIKEMNITNPVKSVGMKLFIAIFGSILACVLTVGLLAYSEAKGMIEKKVSAASMQTVGQAANNLDVIFETYEDISMQLLIDKEYHALVEQIAAKRDDYEVFEASRKLNDKLQSYTLGNSSIQGILLLPLKDSLHPVASGGSLTTRAEMLAQTEWYQKTIELNGKVNWIPPQPTGLSMQNGEPTIGLSRLLKNNVSSSASYMLLMEIEVSTISKRYGGVDLGEGGELAIIDSSGQYVINENKGLIGKEAKVNLPTSGQVAKSGAPKVTDSSGREVLAVYKAFELVDWRLVGTIPVDALVKDADSIRKLTWITATVAALLAAAIGVLVLVTIAKPLVHICQLLMLGASGNLSVRSRMPDRQDEIGTLARSFNGMMEQMTELAERTTQSAEQVLLTAAELTDASYKTALSAKEIAAATEEIAEGAAALAEEAQRGNELAGHIDSRMRQVVEANGEMAASAAEVERAGGLGTASMNQLIQKTGMTEEMTRAMIGKVDALKKSTGSIAGILEVLNGLTKQTNILSLNAAIEASRAGAAGKGFMVVAEEIRKLADQTNHSIGVIAGITDKIAEEIDETVKVLSNAYPLFQEQISSVKEASGIFEGVREQMSLFAQKLADVTHSIGQLDQTQSVMAEAMTNVSAVAEEASASSEEVATLSGNQLEISGSLTDLSHKLDAVSQGLKASLSGFKLK
ncbi:methyl-accepting chemotaxis protein [Paenibacillus sp. GCM10027627]|uniref:methyl-accepting chemotaxis protein n=1 Tax=unclassified Paenibacillus TaxID=185978 RepID=UPI003624AD43